MDALFSNSSELFYFVQVALIIVFLLIITLKSKVNNRFDK